MQCLVQVYKVNSDFSQEYADERYGGEESEFNRKHEWMDELMIRSEIESIEASDSHSYPLQGEKGGAGNFRYDIDNMQLFQINAKDAPPLLIGASKLILIDSHWEKEVDLYRIQLFLTDREPFSNPVPGIYIAAADFPKELIS